MNIKDVVPEDIRTVGADMISLLIIQERQFERRDGFYHAETEKAIGIIQDKVKEETGSVLSEAEINDAINKAGMKIHSMSN